MFRPKLLDTLNGYSNQQFRKDLTAGLIVGVVALPLAIAFAIASGVPPDKGIVTAIVGGFLISALGGSKVQIGGPTGAFIVIVSGIVHQYGINGLIIATFMAGIMLILLGLARVGSVIKFIPHSLITGFTSAIAVLILSSQVKDFFGLAIADLPSGFVEKWSFMLRHWNSGSLYATGIAALTVICILYWPRVSKKIPGSLVALVVATALTQLLHLPIETIGSHFGPIAATFPAPVFPSLDMATIRNLVQPAFTIALLGGIESLLSAVVADGMTGGRHRSNTELIAQGIANMGSAIFGGIPATGAIARTATNVKNGGRTPVAGMVHALVLLLILLFLGRWAALIPMACLAGVLMVVAYHMSEWRSFLLVLKGPKSDAAVLITSFLLTLFVDLTVAIEIGMLLATFLFMRKMIKWSEVGPSKFLLDDDYPDTNRKDPPPIIPPGIEVFEITGPLFFGATHKFKDAMRYIDPPPKVLILRMRMVPFIDASGIKTLEEVLQSCKERNIRLVLSELQSQQLRSALQSARLLFAIGKKNISPNFEAALQRSIQIISEKNAILPETFPNTASENQPERKG